MYEAITEHAMGIIKGEIDLDEGIYEVATSVAMEMSTELYTAFNQLLEDNPETGVAELTDLVNDTITAAVLAGVVLALQNQPNPDGLTIRSKEGHSVTINVNL